MNVFSTHDIFSGRGVYQDRTPLSVEEHLYQAAVKPNE